MNLLDRFRTDRELQARTVGIPLIALLATVLHAEEGPNPFWKEYVAAAAHTFACWHGAFALFILARRQFPRLENTGKRIAFTVAGLVVWVVLVNLLLCGVICNLLQMEVAGRGYWELFTHSLLTSFVLTFMCAAVYEVVYLVRKLMEAQRRTDHLAQENLLAQLSRLKTQIQPHFLFNNFNTLAAVIEEDPKLASRMVQELANFYRYLLAASDKDMVLLQEELDCLEAYAFLLKMRHEHDFTLELNVDPDMIQAQVPALSLQMLVENAVKHTALGPGQPLVVKVTVAEGMAEVENVLRPRQKPLPSAGVGLENLRMRLRLAGLAEPVIRREEGLFSVCFPVLIPQKQVLHV